MREMLCWSLVLDLLLGRSGPLQAAAPPADTASQARAVLARHCAGCHEGTQAKGGLTRITDLASLVRRNQVVAHQLDRSPLWQRIDAGEMPPPNQRGSFGPLDAERIRVWIDAGAPIQQPAASVIAESLLLQRVRADLLAQPPRQRRFLRYITLGHLAHQQSVTRHALAKLVNSLSWHSRLTVPTQLGEDGLLFRLDLRHYRWTARVWDRLTARYPYRSGRADPLAEELAQLAGCVQPWVRADWFLATASQPPFYHDFLQLPGTAAGLERQLGVDLAGDLQEGNAARAGFNNSGVARANRLLQRHDALHGAYWRSHDFEDNLARQNIFEVPLTFRAAGGEIIFHLPNGLQGYLVVDGAGNRIDRAPAEIVRDPHRPDRIVVNGLSCMGCHVQGILPRDDQIRAHVEKNPSAFTADDRERIRELHLPDSRWRTLIREDNDRFARALQRLGIPGGEPEPIRAVVQRYEETLDLNSAAAELGMTSRAFSALLGGESERVRTLGPLLAGGNVQRQVWEELYSVLAASLPVQVVRRAVPPAGRTLRALAWAPDGRTIVRADTNDDLYLGVLPAEEDRLLTRVQDISALAFTHDGKKLVAGGGGRIITLHNLETGRVVSRWAGNTAAVRALAVSPDGRWVMSGSEDRTVRIWDLQTGQMLQAWKAHDGPVTALAVSADGRLLASAGTDRTIRLWQLPQGKELRRLASGVSVLALGFRNKDDELVVVGRDWLVRQEVASGRQLQRRSMTAIDAAVLRSGRLLVAREGNLTELRDLLYQD